MEAGEERGRGDTPAGAPKRPDLVRREWEAGQASGEVTTSANKGHIYVILYFPSGLSSLSFTICSFGALALGV